MELSKILIFFTVPLDIMSVPFQQVLFSSIAFFIWGHFVKRISFLCGSISEIVVCVSLCLFIF